MQLKLVEVQSFVSNLSVAKEFYGDILGFKVKQEGQNWIIFDLNGMEFVIQSGAMPTNMVTDYGKQCATMLVLHSDNIRETVRLLKSKGVEFFGEIVEVPQGKFIGIKDPDGNVIELVEQCR